MDGSQWKADFRLELSPKIWLHIKKKTHTQTRAFNFFFGSLNQSSEFNRLMDENGYTYYKYTSNSRQLPKKKSAADVRVKRISEQADDAHVRDSQSNNTHK